MSEIKPALTEEEWAGVLADPYWWEYRPPQHGGHSTPVIDDRHGLAAAALYGQPFGFTHEDVALLREEAEGEWNGEQMETGRRLLHLAKRIEALLPPKQ